ncbi:prenyltransferase/squalene oxidase repeat-containing protein [Streptomyces marispadix]|uniref:Geranylgeranyl transferase type II subunit beta n=1 Tax=Streptomyces marispadix TaxID=2922868 RepID=A0ABS9T224_9ACTN|nr:prenyltransferase/squalene oxidase repeat-containing protein [Streptomyces marispadix]MCH6162574.1 prenyltransferase [Streptomyces marispadix]
MSALIHAQSGPGGQAQARPEDVGHQRAAGTGEPDLWCTYAAVRTLAWLGRTDEADDAEATARYLRSRRNSDGGYAWSVGMPSDAWATFYCTQALTDLGRELPEPGGTARWLSGTWTQDGTGAAYAMTPGQAPDVWATHFSTRSSVRIPGGEVPDAAGLLKWLGALQRPDGGLSWSRGSQTCDVRACHYGAAAWYALNSVAPAEPPWDTEALIRWLREQQTAEGGFRFSPEADVPCMWATYRATAALDILGGAPARPVEPWIRGLRGASGAFVRWQGYEVEDVWASFCAVGALKAVGASTDGIADAVVARIGELRCAGGGYTYREPQHAADALSTAAAVLADGTDASASRTSADPRVAWLESCQLPNEGGLMYMPARGSEIRCTLWGLTAGAFADEEARQERRRIAEWLRGLQNPDGGFGFWEGRGSELLSTAAAVGVVRRLGATVPRLLDAAALRGFVTRCLVPGDDGSAALPGTEPTLRQGLQAQRIRHALGEGSPQALTALLDRHRVRGGGWANTGARLPDLLSTYEAVATADLYELPVDTAHLSRFTDRVHSDDGGTAWSPLAPGSGGPLADALGSLLRRRAAGTLRVLPDLVLS